jgi:hypothetical protein
VAGDLGTGIHIRFEDAASLQKVVPRELFVALKRVSRDFGLRFEMDSSRQFAQRLVNELESMRGAPGLRWTSVGRGMDNSRDCAFLHHRTVSRSPIKGQVKRKNTSPRKKMSFFACR